jgi:hypothetical protein
MTKSFLEFSIYCRASNSHLVALFIETEFNALAPTTATLSVVVVVALADLEVFSLKPK